MCKNVALLFDDLLWNRFVFLKSPGILIVIDREGQKKRLKCIRPINWGWTNGDPHSALSEGLVTILKLIQRIENEKKTTKWLWTLLQEFWKTVEGSDFYQRWELNVKDS